MIFLVIVGFKYAVSEWSMFVFDLGDFIKEKDINNTNSFSFLPCEQASGIAVENLEIERSNIFI
jgi:hypothetical protein